MKSAGLSPEILWSLHQLHPEEVQESGYTSPALEGFLKIVTFGSLTLNTTLTLCLPNQRRQKLFHLIIYTVYVCGCGAVLRLLLQLCHLKTSLIVLQTVSPKSAFKQLKIKMGTFSKELMRYKLPILKTLGVQS